QRAGVAAIGLGTVILLDAALGLAFAVTGLAAARAPRGAVEQAVALPVLAWMAVLPFLVRR
ncbi:hypothetical protein, partial [Neoroseomonas soli]